MLNYIIKILYIFFIQIINVLIFIFLLDYESINFINDIKNDNFLDSDFYKKLKDLLIGKIRETFNYYPSFIICDDLFDIFNYFFGGSLFINNIRYDYNLILN